MKKSFVRSMRALVVLFVVFVTAFAVAEQPASEIVTFRSGHLLVTAFMSLHDMDDLHGAINEVWVRLPDHSHRSLRASVQNLYHLWF
jgi:hypothetical protein